MAHRNIRAAVRRRSARRDMIITGACLIAATLAVALVAVASWLA
jgi:hypothetical protein